MDELAQQEDVAVHLSNGDQGKDSVPDCSIPENLRVRDEPESRGLSNQGTTISNTISDIPASNTNDNRYVLDVSRDFDPTTPFTVLQNLRSVLNCLEMPDEETQRTLESILSHLNTMFSSREPPTISAESDRLVPSINQEESYERLNDMLHSDTRRSSRWFKELAEALGLEQWLGNAITPINNVLPSECISQIRNLLKKRTFSTDERIDLIREVFKRLIRLLNHLNREEPQKWFNKKSKLDCIAMIRPELHSRESLFQLLGSLLFLDALLEPFRPDINVLDEADVKPQLQVLRKERTRLWESKTNKDAMLKIQQNGQIPDSIIEKNDAAWNRFNDKARSAMGSNSKRSELLRAISFTDESNETIIELMSIMSRLSDGIDMISPVQDIQQALQRILRVVTCVDHDWLLDDGVNSLPLTVGQGLKKWLNKQPYRSWENFCSSLPARLVENIAVDEHKPDLVGSGLTVEVIEESDNEVDNDIKIIALEENTPWLFCVIAPIFPTSFSIYLHANTTRP